MLRRMDRADLTAHGFRSTFRDWTTEQTSYPHEVAEMALAHTVSDKVEAVYRRGDLFKKRRQLMADSAVDFEFIADAGENPDPVCLVAWELRSGRKLRLWRGEFGTAPPYSTGSDTLFVAYYASAEIGCHPALGWPVPQRVLDLFTEFRNRTNGLPTPSGATLIGALVYHGLDTIGATEKEDMRALILRGGPWLLEERCAILDYCESDVAGLARLLPAMLPALDLPRALFRGRYMAAAARIERAGVPIDIPTLNRLRRHWSAIQDELIADIDSEYGVYEGRTFKADRFAGLLHRLGIPWRLLPSGKPDLSDDAFREAAGTYPALAPSASCAPHLVRCV